MPVATIQPRRLPGTIAVFGWRCEACGTRHHREWPELVCGRCGQGPLVSARLLSPPPTEAEAA